MLGEQRARLGWTGRVVALVAILALLLRAALPMPGPAPAQPSAATVLLAGATLCHTDDGGTDAPLPAGAPCDHCALCAALLLPPPSSAPAPLGAPAWIATALPPVREASERTDAPNGRSNRPRGPPVRA